MEEDSSLPPKSNSRVLAKDDTTVELLFRALALILLPKWGKAPSYLMAAFSKRLLSLSLQTGPNATLRLLDFVRDLIGRDTKLDALLSTEDRIANGVYREEVDDPQLCNPFAAAWWELLVLEERHFDEGVRKSAGALRHWKPS